MDYIFCDVTSFLAAWADTQNTPFCCRILKLWVVSQPFEVAGCFEWACNHCPELCALLFTKRYLEKRLHMEQNYLTKFLWPGNVGSNLVWTFMTVMAELNSCLVSWWRGPAWSMVGSAGGHEAQQWGTTPRAGGSSWQQSEPPVIQKEMASGIVCQWHPQGWAQIGCSQKQRENWPKNFPSHFQSFTSSPD